ncbi:UNVERIFIED_CONTAM: hypothetical protein PYX00_009592 [Menopon gallinae]
MENDTVQASNELTETVEKLFESDKFSDIVIKLKDRIFHGHRLVLYARGDHWSPDSLSKLNNLNWEHIETDISLAILRWVYTHKIDLSYSDNFILNLMKHAGEFKLMNLIKQCESKLIDSSCFENCVSFYTIAGEINALMLKNHCANLISKNWNRFTSKDFKDTNATLLYQLMKTNAQYPLHSAVKFHRADLVEVYLNENKGEIAKIINQSDNNGNLPLGLALSEKQTAIATTLCKFRADVNAKDQYSWSLLQRAIQRGDTYSAEFLIKQNADVFCVTPTTLDTCLHLACTHSESVLSLDGAVTTGPFSTDNFKEDVPLNDNKMVQIIQLLLDKGLDPSKKNAEGFTPLHIAVMARNDEIMDILLKEESIDVNARTNDGYPPLWYALHQSEEQYKNFAKKLLTKGARPDVVCSGEKDSLLQMIIGEDMEDAALFLLENIPLETINVNHMNKYGETALHLACMLGHTRLVKKLLSLGAVNIETISPSGRQAKNASNYSGFKQTCLHYAIIHHQSEIIDVLVDNLLAGPSTSDSLDCNLKDSNGNTPLSLAILVGFKECIPKLLQGGADLSIKNSDGMSVLHQAIVNGHTETAIFLLNNGADINSMTRDGLTPLHLSIENRLPEVVESLCRKGVDMSVPNKSGHCPLWAALISGQEDIASILVRNGVDTDAWGEGPDGCYQTLLHKAIDENNQSIAKFLIQSGCDLNTPRRPSPEGHGGEEARDGCTPLHLCCQWNLVDVVQTLLEHGAAVNRTDAEEKTPLHIAIQNQHKDIIALLLCHPGLDLTLRDNSGLTPFAAALTYRNNKAAQAILEKLPTAAEQFNNKGQNFLHVALQNNQVENVLFLLAINVDVNSRVRDQTQTPPLHLAAAGGNEVLIRSLILSGARVNEVDAYKQTALHVAASKGQAGAVSALLQTDAKPDVADSDGNNPLHIACKEGHLAVAK